jgi:hypothetical protein
MTSYQKSLSVDVDVHGGGWGAKFSFSSGFKDVKEGTNSYHKTYVESVAKCIQYLASLKRGIKVKKYYALNIMNVNCTCMVV